jgi:hypothetical protein
MGDGVTRNSLVLPSWGKAFSAFKRAALWAFGENVVVVVDAPDKVGVVIKKMQVTVTPISNKR